MNTEVAHHRTHNKPRPEVTLFIATYPDRHQALAAEAALGRLAAEGVIEVFDAELHDWRDQAAGPRRRTLENLPRLAALPASVWASGAGLPHVGCAPGWSAIVLFGNTGDPCRVHDSLVRAGGATTTTGITADHYAALRSLA